MKWFAIFYYVTVILIGMGVAAALCVIAAQLKLIVSGQSRFHMGVLEVLSDAKEPRPTIGICGNRSPALWSAHDVEQHRHCDLPADHEGWHESDDGTKWDRWREALEPQASGTDAPGEGG